MNVPSSPQAVSRKSSARRGRPRWLPAILAATGVAIGLAGVAAAQPIPVKQRAVDMLALKGGGRLYGAVLSREMDGTTTLAVQRAWLKAHVPKLYAETLQAEQRARTEAPRKRLERIRAWIKQRAGKKKLLPFLRAELKRLQTSAAKPQAAADTQFLLVTIGPDRIRGGFRQPPARRQIALLAWRERLHDVEQRSAIALAKELRQSGKRFDGKPIDLSDRLPQAVLETDRQWAARQAIVEFDYLKRVRFQGTKDVLVREGDEGKQPDLAQLFGSLYQSQLNDLIEEALGNGRRMRKKKDDALQKAIKAAEGEHVRGFRITRLHPDLAGQRVTVEEDFLARMPDGKWATVWSHRETVDASQKRPELEKLIKDDQRVKQALQLAKALGLGANDEQMQTAIRFGAATKLAQGKAAGAFVGFREKYALKLDAAPLRFSGGR